MVSSSYQESERLISGEGEGRKKKKKEQGTERETKKKKKKEKKKDNTDRKYKMISRVKQTLSHSIEIEKKLRNDRSIGLIWLLRQTQINNHG